MPVWPSSRSQESTGSADYLYDAELWRQRVNQITRKSKYCAPCVLSPSAEPYGTMPESTLSPSAARVLSWNKRVVASSSPQKTPSPVVLRHHALQQPPSGPDCTNFVRFQVPHSSPPLRTAPLEGSLHNQPASTQAAGDATSPLSSLDAALAAVMPTEPIPAVAHDSRFTLRVAGILALSASILELLLWHLWIVNLPEVVLVTMRHVWLVPELYIVSAKDYELVDIMAILSVLAWLVRWRNSELMQGQPAQVTLSASGVVIISYLYVHSRPAFYALRYCVRYHVNWMFVRQATSALVRYSLLFGLLSTDLRPWSSAWVKCSGSVARVLAGLKAASIRALFAIADELHDLHAAICGIAGRLINPLLATWGSLIHLRPHTWLQGHLGLLTSRLLRLRGIDDQPARTPTVFGAFPEEMRHVDDERWDAMLGYVPRYSPVVVSRRWFRANQAEINGLISRHEDLRSPIPDNVSVEAMAPSTSTANGEPVSRRLLASILRRRKPASVSVAGSVRDGNLYPVIPVRPVHGDHSLATRVAAGWSPGLRRRSEAVGGSTSTAQPGNGTTASTSPAGARSQQAAADPDASGDLPSSVNTHASGTGESTLSAKSAQHVSSASRTSAQSDPEAEGKGMAWLLHSVLLKRDFDKRALDELGLEYTSNDEEFHVKGELDSEVKSILLERTFWYRGEGALSGELRAPRTGNESVDNESRAVSNGSDGAWPGSKASRATKSGESSREGGSRGPGNGSPASQPAAQSTGLFTRNRPFTPPTLLPVCDYERQALAEAGLDHHQGPKHITVWGGISDSAKQDLRQRSTAIREARLRRSIRPQDEHGKRVVDDQRLLSPLRIPGLAGNNDGEAELSMWTTEITSDADSDMSWTAGSPTSEEQPADPQSAMSYTATSPRPDVYSVRPGQMVRAAFCAILGYEPAQVVDIPDHDDWNDLDIDVEMRMKMLRNIRAATNLHYPDTIMFTARNLFQLEAAVEEYSKLQADRSTGQCYGTDLIQESVSWLEEPDGVSVDRGTKLDTVTETFQRLEGRTKKLVATCVSFEAFDAIYCRHLAKLKALRSRINVLRKQSSGNELGEAGDQQAELENLRERAGSCIYDLTEEHAARRAAFYQPMGRLAVACHIDSQDRSGLLVDSNTKEAAEEVFALLDSFLELGRRCQSISGPNADPDTVIAGVKPFTDGMRNRVSVPLGAIRDRSADVRIQELALYYAQSVLDAADEWDRYAQVYAAEPAQGPEKEARRENGTHVPYTDEFEGHDFDRVTNDTLDEASEQQQTRSSYGWPQGTQDAADDSGQGEQPRNNGGKAGRDGRRANGRRPSGSGPPARAGHRVSHDTDDAEPSSQETNSRVRSREDDDASEPERSGHLTEHQRHGDKAHGHLPRRDKKFGAAAPSGIPRGRARGITRATRSTGRAGRG